MDYRDEDISFTRIVGPPAPGAEAPLPPPSTQPMLVWRPKLGEEHAFELEAPRTTLGRHDENDIVLAGPTVSARHATLHLGADVVAIEDLGSLNGTFVNGQRVERAELAAGDRIQVGPHLLLFVPAR